MSFFFLIESDAVGRFVCPHKRQAADWPRQWDQRATFVLEIEPGVAVPIDHRHDVTEAFATLEHRAFRFHRGIIHDAPAVLSAFCKTQPSH